MDAKDIMQVSIRDHWKSNFQRHMVIAIITQFYGEIDKGVILHPPISLILAHPPQTNYPEWQSCCPFI